MYNNVCQYCGTNYCDLAPETCKGNQDVSIIKESKKSRDSLSFEEDACLERAAIKAAELRYHEYPSDENKKRLERVYKLLNIQYNSNVIESFDGFLEDYSKK